MKQGALLKTGADILPFDSNLGFDRNDFSTVHHTKLPVINEKGMCLNYAVTHEDWAWSVRTEPGVISTFKKVYDTPNLIVPFDVVNFGFPNRKDIAPKTSWPHQDQDPAKGGFRCLQGFVNLLPNGPDDGGLIVCKGGHRLSEQFHCDMAWEDRIPAWTNEWYGRTDEGMTWLEEPGCKWEKLCAEPGELLLFCIYTCYMLVTEATQEDLLRKGEAFEACVGTTHSANARHVGSNIAKRDGVEDPHNRPRPLNEPVLGERGLNLMAIPDIAA